MVAKYGSNGCRLWARDAEATEEGRISHQSFDDEECSFDDEECVSSVTRSSISAKQGKESGISSPRRPSLGLVPGCR